jgi:hypothetical protein
LSPLLTAPLHPTSFAPPPPECPTIGHHNFELAAADEPSLRRPPLPGDRQNETPSAYSSSPCSLMLWRTRASNFICHNPSTLLRRFLAASPTSVMALPTSPHPCLPPCPPPVRAGEPERLSHRAPVMRRCTRCTLRHVPTVSRPTVLVHELRTQSTENSVQKQFEKF